MDFREPTTPSGAGLYYPGVSMRSVSSRRTESTILGVEEIPKGNNYDELEIDQNNQLAVRKKISTSAERDEYYIQSPEIDQLAAAQRKRLSRNYEKRTMNDIEHGILKPRSGTERSNGTPSGGDNMSQSQMSSTAYDLVSNGVPLTNSALEQAQLGAATSGDSNGGYSSAIGSYSQMSYSTAMSKIFHPMNKLKDSRFKAPQSMASTAAADVDEMDRLPNMEELRHFDKRKELGTGTDAHVYEVVDRRDKSHVAMKLTKRKSGRYRTEINLLHGLRTCEYVVRLLKCLENDSVYVLILEQAPMTLEVLLHERCTETPMQERVARDIMEDTMQGIKAVHNLGFVHKDIKPENVLIFANRDARKLQAKIADFGFATRVTIATSMFKRSSRDRDSDGKDDSDTESRDTLPDFASAIQKQKQNEFFERVADKCGTPGFWPPELVASVVELKEAFKMDVFSTGVTLYRMLCNEMPFGLFETWDVRKDDGPKNVKLNKMKPNFQVVSWIQTKSKDSDGEIKIDYIRKSSDSKLSAQVLDIMRGMLRIRPHRRNTVDQCLRHEWIKKKSGSRK